MEELKIYVVGNATYYASWIQSHKLVHDMEEADIVLFTGGEDVDPSYYGAAKHPRTHSNPRRDAAEKEIFDKIKPNQLALGICRGSQFLCVMNGGKLVQDCSGHAIGETHEITDGLTRVSITSTHHQMQFPYDLPNNTYKVLYWAAPRRSHYYDGDGLYAPDREPEIVRYNVPGKPVCLAIQGHPEMMRPNAPIIEVLNELVKKCLVDAHSKTF